MNHRTTWRGEEDLKDEANRGFDEGNTDVAVPIGALAEVVEASKAEAKRLGLKACVKGHVGDGNFHENITYSPSDPVQAANAEKAVKNMVKRALEKEGTCTGEHGIGFGKKEALAEEVGSDTLQMMVIQPLLMNWLYVYLSDGR